MIIAGPFAQYAEHMLDGGYSPIPLRVGEKRPLFDKWDRLKKAAMVPAEIAQLVRKYPRLGLGVAGGFNCLVPIDVDTEDRDVVMAVCRALPVPVVAKQGRRGFTAFYWDQSGLIEAGKWKRPLAEPGKFEMLVEVINTGQTVLPPTIHPDTAEPYRWITRDTLFDVPVDGLSIITPDHIEALAKALKPFMPEVKAYTPIAVPAGTAPTSSKRHLAYANRILDNEVRTLSGNMGGGRNNALFTATCKLGRYVHHGVITEAALRNALMGACQGNGLIKDDGAKACADSITSGLRKSAHDHLPVLADKPRAA